MKLISRGTRIAFGTSLTRQGPNEERKETRLGPSQTPTQSQPPHPPSKAIHVTLEGPTARNFQSERKSYVRCINGVNVPI